MKSILFSVAILVLALFTVDCGNYKDLTSQSNILFRNDWKLYEVQGQVVPDSVKSRFQFTPGRISGTAGCNQLSADFVPGKHQTIRFTPEMLTKNACTDANAAALETTLLDILSKSTEWSMTSGQLTLGDGQTTLVKFRAI